jgi:hypothetical protein
MLEIVGKDETPDSKGFAREMTKLHLDTIRKIGAICEKYNAEPFNAIKIFGNLIFQNGADLQAKFNAKHETENNEENEGGNE